jgi:hypothetical protein
MMTDAQIKAIHAARVLIEETRREAVTYGMGKLSVREQDFVRCLSVLARRSEFEGLTARQHGWLSAIAGKLDATKGKYQWQVIAERGRARMRRYRDAYSTACFGR